MRFPLRLVLSLLAALAGGPLIHAKTYRVIVASADVDRAAEVITFALPADAGRATSVRGDNGVVLPLQVDPDRTATFVVPAQQRGQTLTFVTAETAAPGAGVDTKTEKGRVHVVAGGKPVFDFQLDRDALPRPDIKPEFKRAGYIHPVYSPSGKIVTDDYPSNHVHHHGIWTPWTKTKFQGRSPDFWNMGTKTGAEDLVALKRTWSGRVHGGFDARLKMVDLTASPPVVAINEEWHVTAYQVAWKSGESAAQVFDLVMTQTCATNDPLELPKYHYGGFGFRGAAEWNGPGDAALFLTSEGETDRIKGNDTRGRWCYLGGKINGAISGTAILGHPSNFRAPQPMRLHPNMPYMSYVPQQLGDFAIEPGKTYSARFRFVVTDGPPDRAKLDAFWNGYAAKSTVTLEPSP